MFILASLVLSATIQATTPEIHAVWDHSGSGLYAGNWPKTMDYLKSKQVTDVFVNVAGPDFAHYASGILPRSVTFSRKGDQLAAAIAAAKGRGIRVHAWVICFNLTRNNEAELEKFRKRGWRTKNAKGEIATYLNPANAAVRAQMLSVIKEISSRYDVDGIHIDFVRWGDSSVKPADAASHITDFVAEVRRHVKRPKWLTAAVYGKYPACINSVGQDWTKWLNLDLVDYVVPMDYTESMPKFESFIKQQAAFSRNAKRTIAGIGVTAYESTLSAAQVSAQIRCVRKYGLAGVALFDLDEKLEREILPAISKGGDWK